MELSFGRFHSTPDQAMNEDADERRNVPFAHPATIANLLGRGRTAQMTYYETTRGARVFAAGAFTLAGHTRDPSVRRLLENVWERLSSD